jgi:hypothetical protein
VTVTLLIAHIVVCWCGLVHGLVRCALIARTASFELRC